MPNNHPPPPPPPPPLPSSSPPSSSSSSSATTKTTTPAEAPNKSSFSFNDDPQHQQHQQRQWPAALTPTSTPSPTPSPTQPRIRDRDWSEVGSISPPPLLRKKGKGKLEFKREGNGGVGTEGDARYSRVGSKSTVGPKAKQKQVEVEIEIPESVESEGGAETPLFEGEGGSLNNAESGFFKSTSSSSSSHSHIVSGPTFLDPTVKKTWAYGYDRDDGEDITIEEVLQPDDLRFAVIGAFQWNLGWLNSKINVDSTRLVLIVGAKEESLRRRWECAASKIPHLCICFAPMESPVQIMHAKLMLLFHPTYLRIVVTTANMMPHDWGETGVMENTVFLIDLPRLPPGNANAAEKPQKQMMTSFGINLVRFLDAVGLYERFAQGLVNFDFSRTQDLAFVHSIGGAHVGQDEPWRRTGFCGLGLAIQEIGLESTDGSPVSVDYVTSSLGATRPDFLQALYMACQGDDGLTSYCWQHKLTKSGEKLDRETEFEAERVAYDNIYANLRIYFPVRQSVEKSRGGTACGGTICFNGDFNSYSYRTKALMRDCQSQRSGLLMHNKLIYVRRLGHLSEPSPGWMYVGSANCSQAAWGKMTKDKQLGLPRLTCRNWECGVIIPLKKAVSVPKGMDGNIAQTGDVRGISMSGGIIPVPMHILGMRYKGRNPWGQR